MNDLTLLLKIVKYPAIKKENKKVDMDEIESVFREHNYFGNGGMFSKKVEGKYEIVFVSIVPLSFGDNGNIYYNIYYANGNKESGGIGNFTFRDSQRLCLLMIENHAREYYKYKM